MPAVFFFEATLAERALPPLWRWTLNTLHEPYHVAFEARRGYLLVRVRGPYDPSIAREVLGTVKQQAQAGGFTRILIDGFEIGAPARELDRFLIGEALAELLPCPFKVAFLYKAEWINKFGENTAVNRGAAVLVCSTEAKALQWLLGGAEETAERER